MNDDNVLLLNHLSFPQHRNFGYLNGFVYPPPLSGGNLGKQNDWSTEKKDVNKLKLNKEFLDNTSQ